ncbi:YdcF family protein [Oceanobacillus jeddahense]|uniref:YdcF family protein n=1 Tax=Oceanobacillus jeddahense TaxID=1462527 RepID=A0ABY5JUJ1_9BACI|nr:YdcF family protein [Oceanobacillus jeddahense]UUI03766.1 YdcF family protein [Oceanobacillus jeddahense]
MVYFIASIPLFFFILFLINYLRDPRKLINGLLFNSFLITFILFCVFFYIYIDGPYQYIVLVFPFFLLVVLIPFGVLALIAGLFYNAKVLRQKEGKRFRNSLTLIMAIGILTLIIINLVNPTQFFPEYLQPLFSGAGLVVFYVFLHMFNFLTAYGLNQWKRPKRNQDFIIVLGSGLINDRVPPLLASRIDKAIAFYNEQKKVVAPPKIIFSGGQGPDEGLPEAEAMQNYAVEKGIPIEDTIQENKSVNTYENMVFSKKIMDERNGEGAYRSIFATNNFHLFRAGMYARKAGLDSQGIGSKTAFYYWPNAMVREYIAVVVMGRRRHFMIVSCVMGFSLLLTLVAYFFT